MKRVLMLMLSIIISAGMLAACQSGVPVTDNTETTAATSAATTAETTTESSQTTSTTENKNEGITVNKLVFEEIKDLSSLPPEISASIEKLSKVRGYAFFKVKDDFIVSVNSGERNTGGYSIKVNSVEDNEGVTRIRVIETSPEKDAIVTEAFTYPYTVIRVKGAAENFSVTDVKDDNIVFGLLTMDGALKVINTDGVYSGQIDNSSIEIYINGEPGAFRKNDSLNTVIDTLKEKDKVSLSYFTNEYGQQMLLKLEKKK